MTHELATMRDLVSTVERVSAENGGAPVARIKVWLGALSHFTPEHFREHWEDAARGTAGESAEIDATLSEDASDPNALGVVLEEVTVVSPSASSSRGIAGAWRPAPSEDLDGIGQD